MYLFELAFKSAFDTISDNALLRDEYWLEITTSYSLPERAYHTLPHLDNMLYHLREVSHMISDWPLVVFATAYHDFVYIPGSGGNEEKSAVAAKDKLSAMLDPLRMRACEEMILATRHHLPSGDNDTNYFTDADLSILGAHADAYTVYSKQVREEFSMYPGIIYRAGRRKVLKQFLALERIYKTEWFFARYEATARENLGQEIKEL